MNLKSLRHPDLYHGQLGKPFFEGWYFKLVDRSMGNTFAFIPGVFFSTDEAYSHAFLQIVDGKGRNYHYLRYPTGEFKAKKDLFQISVAENYFSFQGMDIDEHNPEIAIKGSLTFKNHTFWPDSALNPGSMGFYNYIPKMQCYSQVGTMDFDLTGTLQIGGNSYDFSGGKGYIEKNWGSAFPYSWVWVQCNNFKKARASLSCSIGHIPFLFSSFRGFLTGLSLENRFFKFTTLNRSKAELTRRGADLSIKFINKHYILLVDCQTREDNFVLLNGPRDGEMVPLVQENLQGEVKIILKDTKGNELFEDTGTCAGVEYGGKQMLILGKESIL